MKKLSKSVIAAASIYSVALMSLAGTAHAALIDDVTSPGDFIIAIDLDSPSSSPGDEQSANAIIDNVALKYLNFGGPNSGVIVTPSNNPFNVAVTSLTVTTANDAIERDPTSFSLWGTNDPILSLNDSDGTGESWTAIILGAVLNLPDLRFTEGPTVNFANNTHYVSFRLVFPTLKGNNDCQGGVCMQVAEIRLNADAIVPEPATVMLFGLGLAGLGFARRRLQ